MKVELICPDDRPPQPMDMITVISYNSDKVYVYVEDGRKYYVLHFIAIPWSLFKWSVRLGWEDLKGAIRGAPKRPPETIAEAQERIEAQERMMSK